MFYRNLVFILITLFICSLFFVKVNADDPSVNYHKPDLNYAAIVYLAKQGKLVEEWKELDKLEIEQAMLRVQWDDNTEDMVENAISLGNAVTVDVLQIVASIVATTANSIKDFSDAVVLASSRASKNFEISTQNLHVQGRIIARDAAYKHYKAHYDAYVANYSGSLELVSKGGTPSQLGIDSGLSVPCANPKCSTTWSVDEASLSSIVWAAYNKHKVTCPKEHGFWKTSDYSDASNQKDLPTPEPYWDCPDDPGKCPLFYRHKVPCRGGCGTQFADGRDGSHYKGVCDGYDIPESYIKLFGSSSVLVDCPGRFYNCNGQTSATACKYKDAHVKKGSNSSPVVSPTPTPTPTDNTPNCPDCTSHCSSPCRCSNSGTCNGSVYTSPSTPSTSPSTPSTPTTVSCARSGCSASVSSPTEHRVPPCSSCGKSYWTCGDYASYSANQHRVRTCRRSGCGNTWQRCISSTPNCNVASGKRCWAAAP